MFASDFPSVHFGSALLWSSQNSSSQSRDSALDHRIFQSGEGFTVDSLRPLRHACHLLSLRYFLHSCLFIFNFLHLLVYFFNMISVISHYSPNFPHSSPLIAGRQGGDWSGHIIPQSSMKSAHNADVISVLSHPY